MQFNGSIALSRQKINSDYDSVVQQTGLYAGNGGYDIKVGQHTQLDGAVLGSSAEADKNHLSTGTLGWSNLDNRADYKVESQSFGLAGGTDMSAWQNGIASAAGMAGTLAGGNSSGSAASTSYAAISDGSIEIRQQDQQKHDVASISRDVEHAANGLSAIFNKQRELDRLQEAQLIGEIGQQAVQIAVTNASMAALELKAKAKDQQAEADQATKDAAALRSEGKIAEAEQRENAAKTATGLQSSYLDQAEVKQKEADAKWGLTSDYQMAARAASAALQGLAGGNLGQAVSGAAAPYLASVVKDLTTDASGKTNLTANVMAHALLGAVVAQASGGSATAGAIGGGSAPLVSRMVSSLISKEVYGEDDPSKLTEEQKQTVSALTTLAGTLAGAAVGGSSADALTAGQAAKNEVENNSLKDIVLAKERQLPAASPAKRLIDDSLKCASQSQLACQKQLDKVMAAYDKATDGKERAALLQTMEWLKGVSGMGQGGSILDYALALVSEGLLGNNVLAKIKNLLGQGRAEEAAALVGRPTAIDRAIAPEAAVGFSSDTVASAYQGMRSGGGHAIRHLIDEGLISNTGTLESRVQQFEKLTAPILKNPTSTFDWKLGATRSRGFIGEIRGTPVVVFIAKEGPYQGRILSTVVPDAKQAVQWGIK